MRLEIVFKTANSFIPINYQYMLCSFVYKRLKYTDENFASFLHEEGFNGFRMFTFSQLFFENSHVKNGSIIISEGKGKWYISSLSEDFIRNFFLQLSKTLLSNSKEYYSIFYKSECLTNQK